MKINTLGLQFINTFIWSLKERKVYRSQYITNSSNKKMPDSTTPSDIP